MEFEGKKLFILMHQLFNLSSFPLLLVKREILQREGIILALESSRAYPEDSEVQTQALGMLMGLIACETGIGESTIRSLSQEIIPMLLNTIQTHSNSLSLLIVACGLLRILACWSSNQDGIVQSGKNSSFCYTLR